jgi:hypothetical protein
MTAQEIFETLKMLVQKYSLVRGEIAIHKEDDGSVFFDKVDLNFYQMSGCFDDADIRDAFENHEWDIKEEGTYEFLCLLSYSEPQVGNYPPPNVEVDSYMMIEYIECALLKF